jgi:hypothetical protein
MGLVGPKSRILYYQFVNVKAPDSALVERLQLRRLLLLLKAAIEFEQRHRMTSPLASILAGKIRRNLDRGITADFGGSFRE